MLFTEFIREIKQSLNRFLSIMVICALGVAFFAGIKVTGDDMKLSGDALFDALNMMDIRVISTLGMTDDDITEISKIDGVKAVVGNHYVDMLGECDSKQYNLKIYSINDSVNTPLLTEGRMPLNDTECLLDERMSVMGTLNIGDTLKFSEDIEEDEDPTLNNYTFTIVGKAKYPYHFNQDRGSSTVGDGSSEGFILVNKSCFITDYYTDVLATVNNAITLTAYSDEYNSLVDDTKERVKLIAPEREQARYDSIMAEANEKLDDAKAEIADAEKKIADGKIELLDGEKKISDGEAEILKAEKQIADGEKQLADGKKELADGEKEILDAEKEIKKHEKDISKGEKEIIKNEKKLKDAEEEIKLQEEKLEESKKEFFNLKAAYDAGFIIPGSESYYNYEAFKAGIEQGEVEINSAKAEIESGYDELNKAKKELSDAKKKLNDGKHELADAKTKLSDGRKKINDSEKEIADGKRQITESKAELEDGKKIIEESKVTLADGEKELSDAKIKVSDAEKDLADLDFPEWHVLDRSSVQTYAEYERDSDNLFNLGNVFPLIFFLVAMLVSLTTMTRMVDEQRTQIGTLKALGYSKAAIAGKYIGYGLSACLIGSILGALIGEKLLPYVIIVSYQMLYSGIPEIISPYSLYYTVTSTSVAVAFVLAATLMACLKELRAVPATLMRPVAPKAGRKILLERIPLIWNRFSFTTKATIRNLFRYKRRFLMTSVGIGGCMGLLVFGFGLNDSLHVVGNNQYKYLHVYDAMLTTDDKAKDLEKEKLLSAIEAESNIEDFLWTYQSTMDVNFDDVTKTTTLFIPEDVDRMTGFIALRDRKSKEAFYLSGDGCIISEKLSGLLGVKVGDWVTLKPSDTEFISVRIDAITENYFNSYCYMTRELYERSFGKELNYNSMLLNLKDISSEEKSVIGNELIDLKAVTSITFVSYLQDKINDILGNMDVIVLVIITAAGLLAFIVLYNLNNISITARKRELATLKVLGFHDTEVAIYVYRENIWLTAIGIVFGVIIGFFLHKFVITTVEVDLMMFGREINTISYVYAGLLTALFSIIVNIVMYFPIKDIDMVSSLKSVE